MNQKEVKKVRQNAAQRRAVLIELAKRRDARYRKAKEDFKRPAFQGTILESWQQDMP